MPKRCSGARDWVSRSLGAVGALGLVLFAGCRGGLPSTEATPAKPPEVRAEAWQVDHDGYAKLGYRLDWRGFPAVSGGENPVRFIHVDEEVVMVLDRASIVSALEADNGRKRWQNQVASPLTGFKGLGRMGNNALVVGEVELFILDIRTGNFVGREDFRKLANSPPLFYGSILIYGTALGRLRAHEVGTGIELWANAPYVGGRLPGPITAAPILVSGVVGMVSQGGEVSFHDPVTGAQRGSTTIGGGMATDPVQAGGVMVAASLDQSIYGFAPIGGSILWRYRTTTPLRTQPTAHDQRVYCDVPEEGLIAFEIVSGEVLWKSEEVHGRVISMRQGRLIVWDGGETFWVVSPSNGDVLDEVTLTNVANVVTDGFEDGNLYVVSDLGVVGKFMPRS